MKDVALARSKHSQLMNSGKHVQVATLLWSAPKDVTTLPVGAELSFATYVLHFGRLASAPSETEPD
jgi:L-asparaginase II